MKLLEKKGIKILALCVLVMVLHVGFNYLSDGPRPRFEAGGDFDTSSLEAFCNDLFKPAYFGEDNGYYRMFTMTEPEDADITSPEIIMKYRRMHDPQYDNTLYLKQWSEENTTGPPDFKLNKKGPSKEIYQKRKALIKRTAVFDSFSGPSSPGKWAQLILEHRDSVRELQSICALYMKRYREMMGLEIFNDFTIPRLDAVIPNLLAYLHAARLQNTLDMLTALEGDWEIGVDGMLKHIAFTKKVIRGSRTLILSLVGKAVLRENLYGLAVLMNEPEFPKALYDKVIRELPPLTFEEYGSPSLMAEAFFMARDRGSGFLVQENRTRQYFFDFLTKLVNSEKTPPHQWTSHPMENNRVTDGWFWWLQNPVGKYRFEKALKGRDVENLFAVVHKSYWTKTLYEMTVLAAHLHRAYDPHKSAEENLRGLEIYRRMTDPCSGKPFRWSQEKQRLYSYGTDRDDDGGTINYKTLDADFCLPVVLYVRDHPTDG